MTSKICTAILAILVPVFFCGSTALGQSRTEGKIPWTITVITMDGADQRKYAEIPVTEALAFIEAHSRFKFTVKYVSWAGRHAYTPYQSPIGGTGKRKRFEIRYGMMAWNVPQSLINALPTTTSYLFLYKLYDRKPILAGASLPLTYGIMKGGKPRPYSTVAVDQWYYQNTPKQGFRNWSAQILTHEINNEIQAKLEAAPYKCPQLLATQGLPGNLYEAERLTKISSACYAKLGRNDN